MNPFFVKLGLGALGTVCMALVVWWAWGHYIADPYREQGRIEVRKELQPKIDNLKINNKTLTDAYADLGEKATACSDSVRALAAESEKKIAAGIAARAEAEKRASGLQQQAAWLSEQLSKPDNKGKTCSDALKEWRAQP